MRLSTQALPMIGLLAALRPAGRDDHDGSLTSRTHGGGPTARSTPSVAVIDNGAAHRVTLTVAELPKPRLERIWT